MDVYSSNMYTLQPVYTLAVISWWGGKEGGAFYPQKRICKHEPMKRSYTSHDA